MWRKFRRMSLRKKALFVAAGLMLWPHLAHAGPAAGLALVAFLTTTVVGQFILSTVLSIGLSMILAAVTAKPKNQAAPKSGGTEGSLFPTTVNIKQAAAPRQVVYGYVRTGGTIVFAHTNNNDLWMHLVIVVATHEIEKFEQIWINDEVHYLSAADAPAGAYVLDVDGNTTAGKTYGTSGPSLAQFKFHTGSATQAADATLIDYLANPPFGTADSTLWTSADQLKGCAYIYARLIHGPRGEQIAVFSDGLPNITVVVKGHNKIYDPRDTLYKYTPNAALCANNWITDTYYGMGFPQTDVDEDILSSSANICDQVVDHGGSSTVTITIASPGVVTWTAHGLSAGNGVRFSSTGTLPTGIVSQQWYYVSSDGLGANSFKLAQTVADAQAGTNTINTSGSQSGTHTGYKGRRLNRYAVDGVITTDLDPQEVLGRLLSAMRGTAPYDGDKWRIIAGAYYSSSFTVYDSDLRDGPVMQTMVSKRDRYNSIKGTYNGADKGFIQTDFQPISDSALVTEDGGVEVWNDIVLPFTLWEENAQMLATLELALSRRTEAVFFPGKLNLWNVHTGDTITWVSDLFGTTQEYEVKNMKFVLDGQNNTIGIDLELIETGASYYTWTAGQLLVGEPPGTGTTDIDPTVIQPPTSLTTTEVLYETSPGAARRSKLVIEWVESTSPVVGYRVEYKLNAASEWTPLNMIYGVDATIFDLATGTYNVRVAAVSGMGNRSTFVTSNAVLSGDTTVPANPSGLTVVTTASGWATLSWTASTEERVRNTGSVEIRFQAVTSGATWAAASVIAVVAGNSDRYVVRATIGTYLIKFKSATSVYSTTANTAVLSTLVTTTAGVEIAGALPGTDLWDGRQVYLTTDGKTYRYVTGTGWVTGSAYSDITGTLSSAAFPSTLRPLEVLGTLPSTGNFQGRMVFLTTDNKVYRWTDTSTTGTTYWVRTTATTDLSGTLADTLFSATVRPIEVVSALPSTGNFRGRVVLLTTDMKIYRWDSDTTTGTSFWIATVPTTDLTGTLAASLFSSTVRPVEIFSTLPSTGNFQGRTILLTTDNKIYRWTDASTTGTTYWTSVVPATDITGQITTTQITDGAISTPKVAANSIIASHLVIGDFSNRAENGDFAVSGTSWGTTTYVASPVYTNTPPSNFAITAGNGYLNSPNHLLVNTGATNATPCVNSNLFPVTPGDLYYLEAWVQRVSTPSQDCIVRVRFFDASMNAYSATGQSLTWTSASSTSYSMQASTSTQIVVPTNAVYGLIEVTTGSASALSGGTYRVGLIKCARKSGGELIVDGAISADKIAANAVTAGKIAAGEVNATHIAAKTITADKIAIGDSDNRAANGDFFQGATGWGTWSGTTYTASPPTNTAITAGNGFNSSGYHLAINAGATTSNIVQSANMFQVLAGEVYYLEATVQAVTSPAQSLLVRVRFFDAAGAVVANAGTNSITFTSADSSYTTRALTSSADVVVPSGAMFGCVEVVMNTGPLSGGSYRVGRVLCLRRNAGNLIVDGTITTGKIAASAITANELASNSVTSGKIQAGAVSATHIAAKTITADKIAIGDSDNRAANGDFAQGATGWGTWSGVTYSTAMPTANQAITASNGYNSSGYHLAINAGSVQADVVQNANMFQVVPGEVYYLAAVVQAVSPSQSLLVRVRFFDAAGTVVANAGTNSITFTSADSTYTSRALTSSADVVVPSGAVYARVEVLTASASALTGSYRVGSVLCLRRNSGNLIVDGTITTGKIAASAITANELATDSVTAGKIQAGAVSADKLSARSITASKMVMQDLDNRAENGDFGLGNIAWGTWSGGTFTATPPAGYTVTAGSGYNGSGYHLLVSGAASTVTAQNLSLFPVKPGDVYFFSAVVQRNSTPSQSLQIKLAFYTDATMATPVNPANATSGTLSFSSSSPSTYTEQKVSSSAVIVPATAAYAVVEIKIVSGTLSGGTYQIGAVYAAKRDGAELTVDGSITADKIAAGSITANRLVIGDFINRVENGSLVSGAIGWGTWAGASSTVTMTIASPGVVTWTAHGLVAGAPVRFTTTGALPTGVTSGTIYYVSSASLATDTFRLAPTLADAIAGTNSVNTSGSQSGTHTGTDLSPKTYSSSMPSTNTVVTAGNGYAGSGYHILFNTGATNADVVQNANKINVVAGDIFALRGYAQKVTSPSLDLVVKLAFYDANNVEVTGTSNTITWTSAGTTVTITIASPGVVTWASHGLVAGAAVKFATSGSLPTGITAGTTYYVSSSGLTSGSFKLSDTAAHGIAGTNHINTSGSQSGTHTGTAIDYQEQAVASTATVVPSTAVYAVVQAALSSGTLSGGTWRLGMVFSARRNSGELIVDGTITAPKISVTSLSAISADIGTVTAGTIIGNTIKTADSTTRVEMTGATNDIRVYISGTKVAQFGGTVGNGLLEINASSTFYSLYVQNTSVTGGQFGNGQAAGIFVSLGSSTLTGYSLGSAGGDWGVRGFNDDTNAEGFIAGSTGSGGYDFYAQNSNYGPFTGAHDALMPHSLFDQIEEGDIVVDVDIVVSSLHNSITSVRRSSVPNEKGVVGVYTRAYLGKAGYAPSALLKRSGGRLVRSGKESHASPIDEWDDLRAQYRVVIMNALGEGEINVCGEGGNIAKGDLIVASSAPGKGMRQADDIVRSYTVAKARQDVSFNRPDEVKRCACIYLCG